MKSSRAWLQQQKRAWNIICFRQLLFWAKLHWARSYHSQAKNGQSWYISLPFMIGATAMHYFGGCISLVLVWFWHTAASLLGNDLNPFLNHSNFIKLERTLVCSYHTRPSGHQAKPLQAIFPIEFPSVKKFAAKTKYHAGTSQWICIIPHCSSGDFILDLDRACTWTNDDQEL